MQWLAWSGIAIFFFCVIGAAIVAERDARRGRTTARGIENHGR
jgi:hypothetical protein